MNRKKVADNEKEILQVTTPKFRVSFPNVFIKKAFKGGEAVFSLVMLYDKKNKDELADMLNLIKATAIDEWGEVPDEVLDMSLSTCPFSDGDKKPYDGYAGTFYARAASQYPPVVLDTGNYNKDIKPQAILTEEEFYSGCYARASVTVFTWGKEFGKKGVSFGLQNVQKLADGEPFSGRGDPLADFEPIIPEETEIADTDDIFAETKDSVEEL